MEQTPLAIEFDSPVVIGAFFHHRSHRRPSRLGNRLQQLHIRQNAAIVIDVDFLQIPTQTVGNNPRQPQNLLLFAIETGNIHQRRHRLFRRRGLADDVQPAGQQPRFDFHQPPIHRTDDVIPFLGCQILGIRFRQRHILIQIHQPRLIDDRIDDRHPAPGILQGLVRPD